MSIEEFYVFKESLAKKLTSDLGIMIADRDVMTALYLLFADRKDMEWIGDVWALDITYEQALVVLRTFNFEALTQQIEIEDDLIPPQFVLNKKAQFKAAGSIWIIHKNDADPFPSTPHAHNAELNQKLDLSNGNCFKKREFLFKIPKKPFLQIREQAQMVYKGQLPKLAI